MNQKASLVSLAVEKAWADAANAEEAKNNYLEMLKTDDALRTEATARHLEKIAYLDTASRAGIHRHMFKKHVLEKGQVSTPNVSRKQVASSYAKDLFENVPFTRNRRKAWRSTKEDLEKAIQFERNRVEHHTQQHNFWTAIQSRLNTDKDMVRDVWTPEEVEETYAAVLKKMIITGANDVAQKCYAIIAPIS